MPYSETPPAVLERAGMVQDGHFALGNLHTSSVIVRDLLFADSMAASTLCIDIAQHFRDEHIDVVAGPAPRATNLMQFTAKSMYICQDQKRPVRCVYGLKASKEPIAFRFPDTFLPLLKGKRVLVVVDFMKSGDTVRSFIKATRAAGGFVVGVACVCQRVAITSKDLDIPRLFSLVSKANETWEASHCPICREGRIPLAPSPNQD